MPEENFCFPTLVLGEQCPARFPCCPAHAHLLQLIIGLSHQRQGWIETQTHCEATALIWCFGFFNQILKKNQKHETRNSWLRNFLVFSTTDLYSEQVNISAWTLHEDDEIVRFSIYEIFDVQHKN